MSTLSFQFKYLQLPGSDPDPKYLSYYKKAYNCWKEVWMDAYKELSLGEKVHSDAFTRQMEVGALFHELECVGMLFFNWVDFANLNYHDDSYFKIWTPSDIEALTKNGNKVIVCSNTTVSKKWRKGLSGLSMKHLIFYLMAQRFKHSTADAMTALTRRAKGIHTLSYEFGAVPIREDLPHYDETDRVDIGAFYKDTISDGSDQTVIDVGSQIWENRVQVKRDTVSIPEVKTPNMTKQTRSA